MCILGGVFLCSIVCVSVGLNWIVRLTWALCIFITGNKFNSIGSISHDVLMTRVVKFHGTRSVEISICS